MNTYHISYRFPFKVYLLILVLSLAGKALIAQTVLNEDKHKSIALLHFAENISKDQPIEIGIVGENYNLYMNLNKLIKEHQLDQKIKVSAFHSMKDADNCDILYITANHKEDTEPVNNRKRFIISKYHDTFYRLSYENGEVMIEKYKNQTNTSDSAS